jgi:CheY-like chemotaxis protein
MASTQKTQNRVLVVDDNSLVADTIAMVLLSAGFNAIAVYDPERALTFAEGGSFDLLLCDVMMPRMSGIELAIQIVDAQYIPNVILMSGNARTTDLLEDARKRGYNFDVLAKPMPGQEIIDKIRELPLTS